MKKRLHYNYICEKGIKKPVVLFLHGFMGSGDDWSEIMENIKGRYDCLLVDLPGHGRSLIADQAYWKKCDFKCVSKEICHVLDKFEIKKSHIYGYSMGGRLALYLAVFYPHRVISVILESASPGLKTKTEREQRIRSDLEKAKRLLSISYSEFLRSWYKQPVFKALSCHNDFERLIRSMSKNNPDQLARALRCFSSGSQPELWSQLAGLSIPACLLTGEFDNKFTSIAHDMKSLNALISHIIISGGSHKIHFENRQKVIEQIYNFFG
jgi:2-succinyl-6-hydroxy-2,4-cyclohexadiene-1-carboxylate synthase